MIIKSKPFSPRVFSIIGGMIVFGAKMVLNKIEVEPVVIKPGHSYILMCNHSSFWDGLWAVYLCKRFLFREHQMRQLYIMSVKKQMLKRKWLQRIGSFSIDPGKRSILESFDYAGEVLSKPGNLLLYFPQGELESCHIRYIRFDAGLQEIVPRIKGDCQLIWCSSIVEYFESLKASIYSYMLDCGTNHDFNFQALKQKVNEHHKGSMFRTVRYTVEPDEKN